MPYWVVVRTPLAPAVPPAAVTTVPLVNEIIPGVRRRMPPPDPPPPPPAAL